MQHSKFVFKISKSTSLKRQVHRTIPHPKKKIGQNVVGSPPLELISNHLKMGNPGSATEHIAVYQSKEKKYVQAFRYFGQVRVIDDTGKKQLQSLIISIRSDYVRCRGNPKSPFRIFMTFPRCHRFKVNIALRSCGRSITDTIVCTGTCFTL